MVKFSLLSPEEMRGETVFILGGGPSFDPRFLYLLRDEKVVSLNNSVFYCWWSSLFFCDRKWLKWNAEWLNKWRGKIYTTMSSHQSYCDSPMRIFRHRMSEWDPDDLGVLCGIDSGSQSIDLVWKSGASKIVLLAFDMSFESGKSHWHEGYPEKPSVEKRYLNDFLPQYKSIYDFLKGKGVELIRGTPGGRLDFIPYVPIERIKNA